MYTSSPTVIWNVVLNGSCYEPSLRHVALFAFQDLLGWRVLGLCMMDIETQRSYSWRKPCWSSNTLCPPNNQLVVVAH